MIKQNVLPFNLEITNDDITSHSGLALFGEFINGFGLDRLVNRALLKTCLRHDNTNEYTLDISATAIESAKSSAKFTYKGFSV